MRRTIAPSLEPLEGKALLSASPALPSGLRDSVTAVVKQAASGPEVVATLTLKNTTNHAIKFEEGAFDTGFHGTQGGKDVWESNGGIQPDFVVLEVLKPHQSFRITRTWDGFDTSMTNELGLPIGPKVSGTVTISNELDGGKATAKVVLPATPATRSKLPSGLRDTLTAAVKETPSGSEVVATMTVENTTDHAVTFDYGPYNTGFLGKQAGKSVWVSNGGVQPAIATFEVLEPHQSFQVSRTWDGLATSTDPAGTTGVGTRVSGTVTISNELDGGKATAKVVLPKVGTPKSP